MSLPTFFTNQHNITLLIGFVLGIVIGYSIEIEVIVK